MKTLVLAGGCFWCTEAVFQRLKGVVSVESGYTGGNIAEPTYDEVCSGKTGHAESIKVTYDPDTITQDNLLDVFFHLHDPTTLNRQGNDSGTQYRSAIFYESGEDKKIFENKIRDLNTSNLYHGRKIVTTLEPLQTFYLADSSHRDYFNKNSYQPYCSIVIDPKLKKLYKEFPSQVKDKS